MQRPRKDSETWLEQSVYANTPETHQLYLLQTLVSLAFARLEVELSIDASLKQLVPPPPHEQEPETIHLHGYGEVRVFHSTDEVIDFLLNDQEPHER
jgi:hypothetical protein